MVGQILRWIPLVSVWFSSKNLPPGSSDFSKRMLAPAAGGSFLGDHSTLSSAYYLAAVLLQAAHRFCGNLHGSIRSHGSGATAVCEGTGPPIPTEVPCLFLFPKEAEGLYFESWNEGDQLIWTVNVPGRKQSGWEGQFLLGYLGNS